MKDTSFSDLTKEENLNKISIDDRLVEAFIKMMNNFQNYFNLMGYTKSRNYQEYFEKHILHPFYRLLIMCNHKPNGRNCLGYYNYNEKKLVVEEYSLESITDIISILTHEFIHFLVLNNNMGNVGYITPVNEAMTEMLKSELLPMTSRAYLPQILMLKFYHLINDKEINYQDFLNEGKIKDIDYEFTNLFYDFQESIKDTGNDIVSAKKNPYYLKIQRYLINNCDINISSLTEYDYLVYKLANRPIDDNNFMDRFYRKIERKLMENLNIKDDNIQRRFMLFIKEYRKIIEYLYNFKTSKYVITFKVDDLEYGIDKKRNVYVEDQYLKKGNQLKITDEDAELDIRYPKLKKINKVKIKNLKRLEEKAKRLEDILKYLIFISNNIEIEDTDDKILKKC